MELGKFISTTKTKNDLLARWLPQLVDAVEFIHQQGVAHCDIKPTNIFIKTIMREDPTAVGIKLIDFGLACNEDQCNAPRGTLYYWSPEAFLVAGKKDVPRTLEEYKKDDLWALGMTLFQAIHGLVLVKFFPDIETSHDVVSFYQYIRDSENIPLVSDVEYIPYVCITSKRAIFEERKTFLDNPLGQKKRVDYRRYLCVDPELRRISQYTRQQQRIRSVKKNVATLYNRLRDARQAAYLKKKQTSLLAVVRGAWRHPTPTFEEFIQQIKERAHIKQEDVFFRHLLKNDQYWATFWTDLITTTRAGKRITQSQFRKLKQEIDALRTRT
jgi:serine/threonine protein kinase